MIKIFKAYAEEIVEKEVNNFIKNKQVNNVSMSVSEGIKYIVVEYTMKKKESENK